MKYSQPEGGGGLESLGWFPNFYRFLIMKASLRTLTFIFICNLLGVTPSFLCLYHTCVAPLNCCIFVPCPVINLFIKLMFPNYYADFHPHLFAFYMILFAKTPWKLNFFQPMTASVIPSETPQMCRLMWRPPQARSWAGGPICWISKYVITNLPRWRDLRRRAEAKLVKW